MEGAGDSTKHCKFGQTARRAKVHGFERPRLVYRPRKLEPADLEAALRRADFQAAAIERLTSKRRDALLNAVHLFVRASETTADWGQALLFFAAAVDVIAGLAPRKRALSVHDRAAVLNATEKLFGRDDSRQVAVTRALDRVNEVSLTERLRRVSEASGDSRGSQSGCWGPCDRKSRKHERVWACSL